MRQLTDIDLFRVNWRSRKTDTPAHTARAHSHARAHTQITIVLAMITAVLLPNSFQLSIHHPDAHHYPSAVFYENSRSGKLIREYKDAENLLAIHSVHPLKMRRKKRLWCYLNFQQTLNRSWTAFMVTVLELN